MALSMKTLTILLAIQIAVYLPVLRWYLARMTDGSDEPFGFVALGAALIVLVVKREHRTPKDSELLFPSMLIAVYAATYCFVPRLVQAAIAVTALSCTVSTVALGVRVHVPTLGLLLLSLPVVASLQFYLGYPIRVLCGSLTAPLLQLGGIAAVRDGTSLRLGSDLVSIDAPCSGVRMLWTGLFLAFVLSSVFRLSPRRTVLAAGVALCAVILGNVWRSSALFYVERTMLVMPEWCHDAVGVGAFAGVAIFILWFTGRLGTRGVSRVLAPSLLHEPYNQSSQLFGPRHGNVS